MSKHTPGPWRFVWDGTEAVIIGRPTWPCVRHRVKGEWQIAVTDDLIDEHPDEAEANARLIAAAPELLAALQSLQAFVAVMIGRGPDAEIPDTIPTPLGVPVKIGAIMRDAAAAIAKAEGTPTPNSTLLSAVSAKGE